MKRACVTATLVLLTLVVAATLYAAEKPNSPQGMLVIQGKILDSTGNPVLVWQDNTAGNVEIYVKRGP